MVETNYQEKEHATKINRRSILFAAVLFDLDFRLCMISERSVLLMHVLQNNKEMKMNGLISKPIALAMVLTGTAVYAGCDTYSPAPELNAAEDQIEMQEPRFQTNEESGFVLPPDSLIFHSAEGDTTIRGEG